jgi:hypothetical protein
MAGPSIMVRVLGDLSSLSSAFKTAESKGGAAAKSLHEGFQGALSALNRTGVLGPFSETLAGVDDAIEAIGTHAKQIGPAMLGVGGALAGVGAGFTAIGSKDQAAHQQLQAAVEATGKDYEEYAKRVEGAIKGQERFGHTANETQDALRALTTATNDPAKALQYLQLASDLAAAKHIGLTEAAVALGKAYNGNTRILKQFGIDVGASTKATTGAETASKRAEAADKALASAKQHLADLEAIDAGKKHLTTSEAIALRNAQQRVTDATATAKAAHEKLSQAQGVAAKAAGTHGSALDQLATKLHGQAAASADTFSGKLNAIKAHLEDAAAQFGQKYGPAITAAGTAMAGLGASITVAQGISKIFTDTQKVQKATTEGLTAATELQTGATELQAGANEQLTLALEGTTAAELEAETAGLPLLATVGLIALAVAALGAIAYVIYRNWDTIWGAMKTAAKAVWDWIKDNWPYLAGILLGPIGLAAAAIYKHWDTIWGGIQAVWHWIRNNWPLLLAILTGPIGLAVLAIVKHWDDIKNGAKYAIDTLIGLWNDFVGFLKGLPKRIGDIFVQVATAIGTPFRFVFNLIADAWNATVGKLHFHIPDWVPLLGGKGFDVPDIPHLAQGGLITNTGLVFAHAGEVIAPIDKVPRGPAMVINEAHFNNEIDVESLMRRLAWTVQTQRI